MIGEAVAPGRDDVATLRVELREGLQKLRADVYAALFRLAGFVAAVAAVAVAIAKLT